MALLADDPKHRVEQLLIMTERLAALIGEETRRVEARRSPLTGAEGDEKNRLANAYRLEMARIRQDKSLLEGAPAKLLSQLRLRTADLHERLAAHELALGAVKLITEGLVQAMAEEVVRQRGGGANYGASGAFEPPGAARPAIIDRNA